MSADAPNVHGGGTERKLRLYEILYNLNQSFEQVIAHLQELDRFGVRRLTSKKFRLVMEETRAEVNFELVELLQKRELQDWAYFGRLREESERRTLSRGKKADPRANG